MSRKLINYFFSNIYSMNKTPYSVAELLLVHFLNKPTLIKGAFTENLSRHQKFYETLKFLEKPEHVKQLQQHADANLSEWKSPSISSPYRVEVIGEDWGDTTLSNTKKYGTIYTVLNMASSEFPGGGCFEGGNAQEENMWQRSTCVLSLLKLGCVYDKNDMSFHYTEEMKKLIEGEVRITDNEMQNLVYVPNEAFKVFLDQEPRYCFRGPEQYLPVSSESTIGSRESLDVDNSFRFLDNTQIFPFYEMRSAAPVIKNLTVSLEHELRRRIAAQLDTLIIHSKQHVVLGAWGCGQYKHSPEIVATLYAEEIEKRSQCFQHIIFAVRNQGLKSNQSFRIFESILGGTNLLSSLQYSKLK